MDKKVFVKGQEITVCHDTTGIFSDVSTSQALDLIEHRHEVCDTNLDTVERERELYE